MYARRRASSSVQSPQKSVAQATTLSTTVFAPVQGTGPVAHFLPDGITAMASKPLTTLGLVTIGEYRTPLAPWQSDYVHMKAYVSEDLRPQHSIYVFAAVLATLQVSRAATCTIEAGKYYSFDSTLGEGPVLSAQQCCDLCGATTGCT